MLQGPYKAIKGLIKPLSAKASLIRTLGPYKALIPPFLLSNIIPVAIAISPLSFNSQNHVIWTPESRHLEVPKMVPFWSALGANSGPKMAPQSTPKLVKKTIILGSICGSFFFQVLELFGCLFGSLLGLFEAVLGSLGPQKH